MTFFGWLSCYHHKSLRPGCQPPGRNFHRKLPAPQVPARPERRKLSKKVPSSRHVRMDGTHTGKFGAESVRGRKAECAVQRQILSPGGYQGEGISVPRLRAEMGSPWSVSIFDTLKSPCKSRGFSFDVVFSFGRRRPCPCGQSGILCRRGCAAGWSGAYRTPWLP